MVRLIFKFCKDFETIWNWFDKAYKHADCFGISLKQWQKIRETLGHSLKLWKNVKQIGRVWNCNDFLGGEKIVLKQFEAVRKEFGANYFVWNEPERFRHEEKTTGNKRTSSW